MELEEKVYSYHNANNGAGPMWCHGSTSLVRSGDRVFAAGLETIPDAPPLNNRRVLFERRANGWERVYTDTVGRTREPSPAAALKDGVVLVSANPTLQPPGKRDGGPARPEIWQFNAAAPADAPVRILPEWGGSPKFTEHSDRTFVSDAASVNSSSSRTSTPPTPNGPSANALVPGRPKGSRNGPGAPDYAKPEPIRVCYPNASLRNRAVHFLG